MRSAIRTCTVAGFFALTTSASHVQGAISSDKMTNHAGLSTTLPAEAHSVPAIGLATTASSAEAAQPEQWVLVLAGLGAIGWVARRRC